MAQDGVIQFTVRGTPIPKGSKRFVRQAQSGFGVMIDANPKTKPWQELIRLVAAEHAPPEGPWDGPVFLNTIFWLQAPSKIPAGRLGYPTTKPDSLKLCRAVEDALKGIIYKDDAFVVDHLIRKRYGPVGVYVEISKITLPAEEI